MESGWVWGFGAPPRLPGASEGQPPSMDLMTCHLESLVGIVSLVMETWHEPPPWVAPPSKPSTLLEEPGATALFWVCRSGVKPAGNLQGKSAPPASNGFRLVSGSAKVKGIGLVMMTWPLTVAERRARMATACLEEMEKTMLMVKVFECDDVFGKECRLLD